MGFNESIHRVIRRARSSSFFPLIIIIYSNSDILNFLRHRLKDHILNFLNLFVLKLYIRKGVYCGDTNSSSNPSPLFFYCKLLSGSFFWKCLLIPSLKFEPVLLNCQNVCTIRIKIIWYGNLKWFYKKNKIDVIL